MKQAHKMPRDDKNACKLSAVDAVQRQIGRHNQIVSGRYAALLLVAGACALGGGAMAAWLVFLFHGPWLRLGPEMAVSTAILTDILLCLLFFTQHSLMVRRGFRKWLTRAIRADLHGAFYASASGICLLMLVLFWQPVGPPLWQPPGWIRWAMAIVYLLAAICAWWSTRALGEFDALGIKPALGALNRTQTNPSMALIIRGPYRWVRHPLYLLSLVLIWSGPVFTPDRLLHNLLWSIWIVIGAVCEERDLVDCFGDTYRAYRKSVPMLIPRSLQPRVPDSPPPMRHTG